MIAWMGAGGPAYPARSILTSWWLADATGDPKYLERARKLARFFKNRIRTERDQAGVAQALTCVRRDAEAGANVMPAIVEAVKAYASVGEITKELVKVYGRYQEPIRF